MVITEERTMEGLRYIIRFPDGFDERKKYPLMMFLHGSGTRGEDIEVLKRNSFFRHIPADAAFIAIAPLCTKNSWWDHFESLRRFVKAAADMPFADASRFSLIGNSMGGYGAWALGMSIPEYFSALVPICGGGMYWNAARLQNVPVWAFHGGKDRTVLPEESRKMVDAVNRKGGNARLTVYPENGHNSWDDTYRDPAVFRWMIFQTNDGSPAASEQMDAVIYG